MKPVLSLSIFLASLFVASASRAETLNLLIWESYIDQSILDDWTAKTGVDVRQIYYDSEDSRSEILADPNNNIDLVVINENGSLLNGKRGILEPLPDGKIASLSGYTPDWRKRCADFGIPYLWGTMGILYRSDMVKTQPTSWADLMKPAPALKGHIAMFSDHNEAFVPSLILLGQSINTNDMGTLKAAFELMKGQAPSVVTYDYIITVVQNPDFGDNLYMALGYSGDQHVLNEKIGKPDLWRYAVPTEGTFSWLDCMSVSAKSKRKALALQLLDHIAKADNAAKNAISHGLPTPGKDALMLVPEAIRNDPTIYPPPDVMARSQYQQELSTESVQARRRILSSLAHFRDP